MARRARESPSIGPSWQFLQCFGERAPGEEVQEGAWRRLPRRQRTCTCVSESSADRDDVGHVAMDVRAADIISAVEFDKDGTHLATGDHGGRVVLFDAVEREPMEVEPDERPSASNRVASDFEYRYTTEFQSHEPEFDYLKSLEIEEKINKVRWCPASNGAQFLLSTNDKTIKLWKVYEKRVDQMGDFNVRGKNGENESSNRPLEIAQAEKVLREAYKRNGQRVASRLSPGLKIPKVVSSIVVPAARCRRLYANGHAYHINSLSLNSDCETFMSADDLRINLWHLDRANQSFNIVDIKPDNMEDLTEVITSSDFHPTHCNIFAYSSSKGCLRLGDMRDSALCDRNAKVFEEQGLECTKSFFSEIITSISYISFSADGRYLLSRDYMTVKVWDVNMESSPVATFQVHEPLQGKLCDLYESDAIFDKFDCTSSSSGQHIATGTYGHCFRVFDLSSDNHQLLEASKLPYRPTATAEEPSPSIRRGIFSRSSSGADVSSSPYDQMDTTQKLLHLSWHPQQQIIAAAASNSLYLYCAP